MMTTTDYDRIGGQGTTYQELPCIPVKRCSFFSWRFLAGWLAGYRGSRTGERDDDREITPDIDNSSMIQMKE